MLDGIDHAAELKHLAESQADEVTNLNLAMNPVI